jgi:hypothetical protein
VPKNNIDGSWTFLRRVASRLDNSAPTDVICKPNAQFPLDRRRRCALPLMFLELPRASTSAKFRYSRGPGQLLVDYANKALQRLRT